MATTVLPVHSAAPADELPGRPCTVGLPQPRRDAVTQIPVPPDHRTEQARRHSEAEQAAIDIAAGW